MKKAKGKKDKIEGLIVVIRISGMVKVNADIAGTLDRMKLRRKYSCVLIDSDKKDVLGMLEKVKYYVAYGDIEKDVLVKLIEARAEASPEAKASGKSKIDAKKIAEDLFKEKSLKELGLKPFFRLHPPRKGIKSKLQYPKGVLGNNKKDINKLLERML